MMDMLPHSWSVCLCSCCCHVGDPSCGFLLVPGFFGAILLVIIRVPVYCVYFTVVVVFLALIKITLVDVYMHIYCYVHESKSEYVFNCAHDYIYHDSTL